jgi:hypothetical protein
LAYQKSQSPKDDLESLAYMLIYFARGSLPWQGCADANEPTNHMRERITRLKLTLPIDLICKGLPSAFSRHLMYVRSLTYNDKPDYAKLRAMYQRLMRRLGYEYDGVFDWDLMENGKSNIQQQQDKEQEVNAKLSGAQDKLVAKNVKEDKEEELPTRKLRLRVKQANPATKKIREGKKGEDEDEAKQQNKETIRPKRRIIFIKKADNETTPPLTRQRTKPAQAEKKTKKGKAVAKKTPANKIVAKKAPPRKPRARIKAC